jgi:hypothetical protein
MLTCASAAAVAVVPLQMHLPGAIRRGKATRCSHCNQKGATLKCVERSCAQHFHLACARVAGCTLIVSLPSAADSFTFNLLKPPRSIGPVSRAYPPGHLILSCLCEE